MSISLELIHETDRRLYFLLPDVIDYQGKHCKSFSKNSPSNLIRALNNNQKKLHEILLGKENFSANWDSARIERKKIVVDKFFNEEDYLQSMQEKKERKNKKDKIRHCVICHKLCEKSRKMRGCCSDKCREIKVLQINDSIKKTHWCRSDKYEEIKEKRIRTRKENDNLFSRKYTPWNKGKTGIYSDETTRKIRNATIRQFHSECFKKTSIEKKVDEFLKEQGIHFKYSFILEQKQYDFYISSKRLIIEVHGDFWHGNPEFWGNDKKPLRDHQIKKKEEDKRKEEIARRNSMKYIVLWESDINNHWEDCKNKIMRCLNECD